MKTGDKMESLQWLLEEPLDSDNLEWEHKMDISASIYCRMEELGMSKSDLAQRMGVDNAQVSRILAGKQNMTLKTLAKLENALSLRLDNGFKYFEKGIPGTVRTETFVYGSHPMEQEDGSNSSKYVMEQQIVRDYRVIEEGGAAA